MKKLVSRTTLIAAAIALSISCGKNNGDKTPEPGPGTNPPAISFTQSGNIELPFEAGTVTLDYTVTNPVENATVEADAAGAEWISDFNTSTDGSISFTVTENEKDEPRSTILTLKYIYADGEVTAQTNVIQDINGYKYNLNASFAYGFYYGDRLTNSKMYYVWLTETPSSNGKLGTGLNYCFPVFASDGPEDMSSIAPPEGTYTLSDTYEPGTFNIDESRLVNGDDGSFIYFTEGTLTITKNNDGYTYMARVTDENGDLHKITYTGTVALEDDSSEPTYSSLTGDYTANLTGATCTATYFGDDYGTGTSHFVVRIFPEESGDALSIDMLCPISYNTETGIAEGKYNLELGGAEFSVLTGAYSIWSLIGTWFFTIDYDGAAGEPWAPLTVGTVEVKKSGDNVTISVSADDDLHPANTLTAEWTGKISYTDGTSE